MVGYYRDMWRKHANAIFPLAKLCYNKVRLKWADIEQYAFMEMKKINESS